MQSMKMFDIELMLNSLHKHKRNSSELIAEIDNICSATNEPVRVIPFSSDGDPIQILARARVGSRKASLVWTKEDVSLFSLRMTYMQGGTEKKLEGFFFILFSQNKQDSLVAITMEDSVFQGKGLFGLLQGLYPIFAFTFLSHKKYQQMLVDAIRTCGHDMASINRASVKFRLLDHGENRRRMSAVVWPAMKLDEAFQWVQENDGYFNSMNLTMDPSRGHEHGITYTRQGALSTNRQFSHFFKTLVMPVCEVIASNRQFFGHRSRRETANMEVKPLIIAFPFEPFTNKGENHKFIEAMRRLSNSSVSVVHGNPYIHLSVIDYCDGSTYDLWVLSSSRLIMAPQLKGTVQSITRLVAHIFDTFAEGKIRDYSELNHV